MTPEEKWNRLNRPQCYEDYGLSISEDELRQFPKGRRMLTRIKRQLRDNMRHKRRVKKLAQSVKKTWEVITAQAITNSFTGGE